MFVDAPVPPADRYSSRMPPSETVVEPVFFSSTKSFLRVAPALPPPPYTWFVTRPGPAVFAVAGARTAPPLTTVATVARAANTDREEGMVDLPPSRDRERRGTRRPVCRASP